MLERMQLIRVFEEKVIELTHKKELEGLVHVGIGQEGVAVGVANALLKKDYLYGTHRSHGHFLARGADPNHLMAELGGKETGYCLGHGGSMHIVDTSHRLMTATGIVGGSIPLALGTAWVAKEEKAIVIVFFGDGAINTGGFHECLNMAALWKLPVLLVCENNGYAEFTPMSEHTVVKNVSDHAKPYRLPSQIVNGNDVLAVFNAIKVAAQHARKGKGPFLIECLTYRLRGHYVGDPESYRDAKEVTEWRNQDPLRLFSNKLLKKKLIHSKDLVSIQKTANLKIDTAVNFMRESNPASLTSSLNYVYGKLRH